MRRCAVWSEATFPSPAGVDSGVRLRPQSSATREEFERFVSSCSAELLRTAYLIAWDLAEAEDLVQESLFRVARRWHRVRAMEHPAAYARRILVNIALDGGKRRSRRSWELEHGDDPSLEQRADEQAARELGSVAERAELMAAIAKLAPRQRAVLVLRYFEDLSEAQVADLLGCSVGTVKSTSSRALARLQGSLGSTVAGGGAANGGGPARTPNYPETRSTVR